MKPKTRAQQDRSAAKRQRESLLAETTEDLAAMGGAFGCDFALSPEDADYIQRIENGLEALDELDATVPN